MTLVAGVALTLAAACGPSSVPEATGADPATTPSTSTTSTTGAPTTSTTSTTAAPTTSTSTTVPIAAARSPWRLSEVLPWIEVPSDDLWVTLIDTRRMAAQWSIPVTCGTDDEVADYTGAIADVGRDALVPWVDARFDGTGYESEFGFSLCDVAVVGQISQREPRAWVIDRPMEAVREVLESEPIWSEELEAVPYGPHEVLRWGDSIVGDLERVSAARPVGYGGQVVLDDAVFVRSVSERGLHGLIDAQQASETLHAYDSVHELVEYMLLADAHTAKLFAPIEVGETLWKDEQWGEGDGAAALDGVPVLAPYEFFAITVGTQDGGTDLVSIVILNETEEAAMLNKDRFLEVMADGYRLGEGSSTRGWADTLPTDVLTANVFGKLTVVSFGVTQGGEPSFGFVSILLHDALRWHGAE